MTNKPKFSTIVLVEGIFDMLKLYDNGITFVMTAFGTQTMNEDKLGLLRMLGVHELHVLFDGDEAGQAAAEKIIPLADGMGFNTKNIVLTNYFDEGADPGSLTKEQIRKLKTREWPES
jgi:DNA primase